MDARRWLVLGASGGVGAAVLGRLREGAPGDRVDALSRAAREPSAADGALAASNRTRWHAGDLNTLDPMRLPLPTHVVSAGPLDAFSAFAARATWPAGTVVVALSSMSATTKAGRGHRSERAVAQRLLGAEARLAAQSERRGWSLVVLRPTLIWGAGDHSITPLLALARRIGTLPLPGGATGRRQPVHAADLAQALVQAARQPGIGPGPWPAPGGEVLRFDEMLARALAAAVPGVHVLRLPDPPCRVLEALCSRLPGRPGRLASQMCRARSDLDVDTAPVWSMLGLAPRGFHPDSGSFPGLGVTPLPPQG